MNNRLNEFIQAVENGTEFEWIRDNGLSSFSENTQKAIVQAYISAVHGAKCSSWADLKAAILESLESNKHFEQNGIEEIA